MPIVFLSPSTQDWNPYVTGSGSEEYWMNRIVDAMDPYLAEKVPSIARRMRWKGDGFCRRFRRCAAYPTTPHPSRRDHRATFPSRGRHR